MSKCTIDVSFYPFDAQKCELKFASWSTEVTRVRVINCYIVLNSFYQKFCYFLLSMTSYYTDYKITSVNSHTKKNISKGYDTDIRQTKSENKFL